MMKNIASRPIRQDFWKVGGPSLNFPGGHCLVLLLVISRVWLFYFPRCPALEGLAGSERREAVGKVIGPPSAGLAGKLSRDKTARACCAVREDPLRKIAHRHGIQDDRHSPSIALVVTMTYFDTQRRPRSISLRNPLVTGEAKSSTGPMARLLGGARAPLGIDVERAGLPDLVRSARAQPWLRRPGARSGNLPYHQMGRPPTVPAPDKNGEKRTGAHRQRSVFC